MQITLDNSLNFELNDEDVESRYRMIAARPLDYDELCVLHNIFSLEQSTIKSVIDILSKIPTPITKLLLDAIGIGDLFDKEEPIRKDIDFLLRLAFAAIPTHIKSINLSNNNLSKVPSELLAALLSSLASHSTQLFLDSNEFYHLKTKDYIKILQSLSGSIQYLSLKDDLLFARSNKDLAELFAAIPRNITHLCLFENTHHPYECLQEFFESEKADEEQINKFYSKRLTNALKLIPHHIVYLGLSEIFLQKLTCEELKEILLAIPFNVKHLDVTGHQVFNTPEKLSLIPKHINYLSLSASHICTMNTDEIINFFSSIPSHIYYLALDNKNLVVDKLKDILMALPTTITYLDFSCNQPLNKNAKELVENCPAGVYLNLRGCFVADGHSYKEETFEVLHHLPSHITHLDLSCNSLHRLSAYQLEQFKNIDYPAVVYLSEAEINTMTEQQLSILQDAFSNVKTIILLDNQGNYVTRNLMPNSDNLISELKALPEQTASYKAKNADEFIAFDEFAVKSNSS